jgi:hypothetical protein
MRSSLSSIPTEIRTKRSVTPSARRVSRGVEACVISAGNEIKLSTPPRLRGGPTFVEYVCLNSAVASRLKPLLPTPEMSNQVSAFANRVSAQEIRILKIWDWRPTAEIRGLATDERRFSTTETGTGFAKWRKSRAFPSKAEMARRDRTGWLRAQSFANRSPL